MTKKPQLTSFAKYDDSTSMIRRFIHIATLFAILFFSPDILAAQNIRVLICDGINNIELYSKTGLKVNGIASGERAIFQTKSLRIGDKEKMDEIEIRSVGENLIWMEGQALNGRLIIKSSDNEKLMLINELPLEDYVVGTVFGELPKKWPVEALKAQAVAARSYALSLLDEQKGAKYKGYDIRSTIEDQVYKGLPFLNSQTAKAIQSTADEILTYHGKPIKARYHSSCGGETETSIRVWNEKDVTKSIKDPYCNGSPHNSWKFTLSSRELEKTLATLGFNPGHIILIKTEKYENGRVAAVAIHGSDQTLSLTGNDFRRYIGFTKIKSTNFDVSKNNSAFVFSGKGFGHGVGMCQWGAKGMAEKGYSYKDILAFYYPGTKVETGTGK